jgi:hypothetical protein
VVAYGVVLSVVVFSLQTVVGAAMENEKNAGLRAAQKRLQVRADALSFGCVS